MDEVIYGGVNPLIMGSTVRLDLTRILEATGELQRFLDLGAARLRATGPLSQDASERLIFSMADELEDHLRAMRLQQGTATIHDIRTWIQAWMDEREAMLIPEPCENRD
jgi:hypothetical protein